MITHTRTLGLALSLLVASCGDNLAPDDCAAAAGVDSRAVDATTCDAPDAGRACDGWQCGFTPEGANCGACTAPLVCLLAIGQCVPVDVAP